MTVVLASESRFEPRNREIEDRARFGWHEALGRVDEADRQRRRLIVLQQGNFSAPRRRRQAAAKNVLTLVDNFDKEIAGVRVAYDFLCEFRHPNSSGHFFTFGEVDKSTWAVRFYDAAPRVKGIQGHVVTCFMLIMFAEAIMDTFDRNITLISEVDGFNDPWLGAPTAPLRKPPVK